MLFSCYTRLSSFDSPLRFRNVASGSGAAEKGGWAQLHCSALATVSSCTPRCRTRLFGVCQESLDSAPLILPLIATTITSTLVNHSASLSSHILGHAKPLRTLSARVGTPDDWLASSECHFGSRPPLPPTRLAVPIVLASLRRRIVASSQLPGLTSAR